MIVLKRSIGPHFDEVVPNSDMFHLLTKWSKEAGLSKLEKLCVALDGPYLESDVLGIVWDARRGHGAGISIEIWAHMNPNEDRDFLIYLTEHNSIDDLPGIEKMFKEALSKIEVRSTRGVDLCDDSLIHAFKTGPEEVPNENAFWWDGKSPI